MSCPLFNDLKKTAKGLFNRDNSLYNGKTELAKKLENGMTVKTTFTRTYGTGALTSALELKRSMGKIDFTTKLSSNNQSSITLEHATLFPNLTARLERPLTPAATPADKPTDGPVITAEYKAAEFTAAASLDAGKQVLNFSASANPTSGVFVGLASAYRLAEGTATAPRVRVSLRGPDAAELCLFRESGEELGVSAHRNLAPDTSAAVAVQTGKGKVLQLLVGGEKRLKSSSLKGDVDLASGVAAATLTSTLPNAVKLTLNGQAGLLRPLDPASYKLGVTVAYGP